MKKKWFIYELQEGNFYDEWATAPEIGYNPVTNGHLLVQWGDSDGYHAEEEAYHALLEITKCEFYKGEQFVILPVYQGIK